MRLLAVDVGTGTQDILLFDTSSTVENCFQMVMPSPTRIFESRIREATRRRLPIFLTGVTMGGGPCAWALEDHLRAGLAAFATPDAARTLNDDLEQVEAIGVKIVSEDEVAPVGAAVMRLKDFDMHAIEAALAAFGVPASFEGIAVAVFDHGAAPPGVSDRAFRFDYLRQAVAERSNLLGFAHLGPDVPPFMTRMRAVLLTIAADVPVLLLDTGPAAALGALEDKRVAAERECLVLNIGNFHTLAFLLVEQRVKGLWEHHTGFVAAPLIERLLHRLAEGTITNEEVFEGQGHGAFCDSGPRLQGLPFLAVTGPRRELARGLGARPHLATPYGDMMMAGCFGLVRAFAHKMPEWREEIEACLSRSQG